MAKLDLSSLLPPALSTGLQIVSGIFNRNQERKEYLRMLKYNSPKAQMQRFREAGLSPYLIYGQGTAGNAGSPSPAISIPQTEGLAKYISYKNFQNDQRMFGIGVQNALTQGSVLSGQDRSIFLDNVRKQLEMYADYPAMIGNIERTIDPKYVDGSFRRKMNELKLASSVESIEKIRQAIAGMSSDNVVRSVKARYASEFGMVGGDWTQGLGLIKSLPSFFKSRAKTTIPSLYGGGVKVRYYDGRGNYNPKTYGLQK